MNLNTLHCFGPKFVYISGERVHSPKKQKYHHHHHHYKLTTCTQVRGGTSSRVVFKDAIPATFTICSVSRYTGPARGRIISADGNWMHGHDRGQVGAGGAPSAAAA